MKSQRILVADTVRTFRAGVCSVLARDGFEVAEASTADELLALVVQWTPDVVLLDDDLPPRSGVEVVQALRRHPRVRTVVWSFGRERERVLAAVRAGAHGYLDKEEVSAAGLIRALRAAIGGEAVLSRDLATVLIEAVRDVDNASVALDRLGSISARERQVLELIARGASNKQIADTLTISQFTVKRHVQNILHKLKVPSRREAALVYVAAVGKKEAATTVPVVA